MGERERSGRKPRGLPPAEMFLQRYQDQRERMRAAQRYHELFVSIIFRPGERASTVVTVFGLVSWVGRNVERYNRDLTPEHVRPMGGRAAGEPILILARYRYNFTEKKWMSSGTSMALPLIKIDRIALWHPGTAGPPHLPGQAGGQRPIVG